MNDLLPFTGTEGSDAAPMCLWKTKISLPTNYTTRAAPSPYSSGKRAAYLAQLLGMKQAREVVKQVLPDDRIHRMKMVRERLEEKQKIVGDVSNKRDAILLACRTELHDFKLPVSSALEHMDQKNLSNPRSDAMAQSQNRSYQALAAGYSEYI
jgi:hypothetical protein